jgi:hypothetical protein
LPTELDKYSTYKTVTKYLTILVASTGVRFIKGARQRNICPTLQMLCRHLFFYRHEKLYKNCPWVIAVVLSILRAWSLICNKKNHCSL